MPENHRILYFSSQFPNRRSPSMGVFSLQRVRALRRAGCEMLVVSPLLMNPPPGLISKPGQAYRWIKRQAQQPFVVMDQGIPAHYPKWICPPRKIFGWMMSYFLYLQVRNTVMRLVKGFRPDVILSSWMPDAVVAAKLGNALNLPVLAIADGTDVNVWPEEYRGWSYARDILNEKISTIIFVSEALRSVGNSKGLYGKKNSVLHNAVDVHMFKPGSSPHDGKEYRILGVGRFVEMKGFQVLLEALAELNRRSEKPVCLTLIGDGPQREDLIQKAALLGVNALIEIVDPMEQEKLVNYYQETDVFCIPSFSEGLPCVIVEAMACGKPVVASSVGGIPEVIDAQSGILVKPGDANILCEALLEVQHRAWDKEIIRKKIVDNFSWEKWSDEMLGLMGTVSR